MNVTERGFFVADPSLKALPYYKWFWQDYRANRTVQRMSYIERGLYRELLDECWCEGSIPSDMDSLAEICGCPIEVMADAWQVLGRCFKPSGSRLINEKMESMRTETDRQRIEKSLAGRSGGIAKSLKEKEAVADASRCQAEPSGCHIEEKRREEKSNGPSVMSSGKPSDEKPSPSEQIPYQSVLDAYNENRGLFPEALKLTAARKRLIKARWNGNTKSDRESLLTNRIDYWRRYFAYCSTDVEFFRRAAAGENRGEHAGWRPSFDYLMREQTWIDVLEGTKK